MVALSWQTILTTSASILSIASAYRPVQHCKQLGDNGHYSACTSLTQHYNQSSGESDLFIRYHWYKYESSKNGWHAFALGKQMAGALMFIMYGDPTASADMTFSVRSAEGHAPPRPISEIAVFDIDQAKGRIPTVDVLTSKFNTYTGPYEHPELHLKPSHVGIAEFIIRGYAKWIGTTLSNTSTDQPMIWSSKYDQDFAGDYSVDRAIEMHAFGLGFGFVFVDLLNAETPIPMFGAINEQSGHKGLVEVGVNSKPIAAETSAGEFAIKNAKLDAINAKLGVGGSDEHNAFNAHGSPTTTSEIQQSTSTTAATPAKTDAAGQNISPTYMGKTMRDWFWHLHGTLMCIAFFILYPLGVYLLRSPKQISNGESFNYHWTVQALATVVFTIGAFTGYLNSHGISITHQFVGVFICFLMGAQMILGWRHHVKFLVVKRKTILSKIHIGTGRTLMPLGFINILTGMKLRGYGWFTLLLALTLIIVEVVFFAVYLRAAHVRRDKMGGAAEAQELKAQGPGKDDDAEEYFQLGGEDDSESEDEAVESRRQQKRAENERLARLDRV